MDGREWEGNAWGKWEGIREWWCGCGCVDGVVEGGEREGEGRESFLGELMDEKGYRRGEGADGKRVSMGVE